MSFYILLFFTNSEKEILQNGKILILVLISAPIDQNAMQGQDRCKMVLGKSFNIINHCPSHAYHPEQEDLSPFSFLTWITMCDVFIRDSLTVHHSHVFLIFTIVG